jgi:3D (Asp-Asp-Asp) domain-containing protein
MIQLQGSARVRLEDGTMLRINYDAHNGYPFVPISRILIQRKIFPREEMSPQRVREWMRSNPESAEEVRRQNRSFVFFRIVGLSDDREAIGAQGIPLSPGRSIAIDNSLHVYGTPFFIRAGVPLTADEQSVSLDRLMIAQDTGSAIVGPARADVFWGAGDWAGRLAGRLRHPGTFVMLVPREIDPVAAGAQMPLPPEKPSFAGQASARAPLPKKLPILVQGLFKKAALLRRDLRNRPHQQAGCSGTGAPRERLGKGRELRFIARVSAGAHCVAPVEAPRSKDAAEHRPSGLARSAEQKRAAWRSQN